MLRCMMLPISLLAALQGFLLLAEAQQPQQLVLEKVVDLSTSSLPDPPTFRISPSADPLFISVALCNTSDNSTRFFLTNDTTISNPGPSNVDSVNTLELVVPDTGFNEWSNWFMNGGILSVLKGGSSVEFELLVSAQNSSAVGSPFVGDTTANQALLFSPPFNPVPTEEPTFPNYTLPAANLSFPPPPSPPTNFSLVIAPTSSSGLASLPRTACALKSAVSKEGTILVTPASGSNQGLWLRDSDGWRWQWLVNGLNPRTNYTFFALRDGVLASSRPFYFITKSATFNCPLVHSLPFCPTVSYAVPITPPRGIATSHTAATLPDDVTDTVLSVLTNFTTTLSTLACGRDYYSPLVTCADCQLAYRRWLCAVAFPRCGDASAGSFVDAQGAQLPLPALQSVPKGAPPRNPVLPPFASDYQTLLPCLETCNAADRACPNFLNFKCPLPRFTAADSYAVGYIDSGEEGVLGGGSTGVAQDEFGHVWCNLG